MRQSHQWPLGRPHVGFLTDSFLDTRGELFEGGAERHLLHLASVAKGLGAEATIYQRGSEGWERSYRGIRVVALPQRRLLAGRTLAARALHDGCTHLHFQYLNQVPWRSRGVTVTATGHAVYWDIPYVDRYRSWYPGGRLAAIILPIWRLRERRRCLRAVGRCERVMVTDSSMLRLVQSDRPGLRLRVEVVPNFSDLPHGRHIRPPDLEPPPALQPLLAARQEGAVVVLVPRNLSFVRGGAWLPEIVERTLALSPAGRNCHFFLTGTPVNVYGAGGRYRRLFELQLSAVSSEARERMHLLGGVPRAWMRAAYEAADVVLVPTFAHEGTSLAAIEAMGAGRPVVATNVGGLNDLVADRVSGVLAPPEPGALAAAVAELAQNSDLRTRLGAEGQRRVSAMFGQELWHVRAESFGRRSGWATAAESA